MKIYLIEVTVYHVVKNLDYLPDYIKENLNKYSDWIKD